MSIAALVTEGIGPGSSVTYLLTGGLDIGAAAPVQEIVGRRRRRFRSWRSHLYAWDEVASPPPPEAVPEPVAVPSIEDGSEIPEDVAAPLAARLAAIEAQFLERARKAQKAKAKAERQRQIERLAEAASAQAYAAIREAQARIAEIEAEERAFVRQETLRADAERQMRRQAVKRRNALLMNRLILLAADDGEDEDTFEVLLRKIRGSRVH